MKVAVSIPDDVFQEAERLARHLNSSRSELYARALAAYVGSRAPRRVTDQMNAVADAVGTSSDPFGRKAARRVFDRVEW